MMIGDSDNNLSDWQLRMLSESNDLVHRCACLTAFINSEDFTALPTREKDFLTQQQVAMVTYVNVLAARIRILFEVA